MDDGGRPGQTKTSCLGRVSHLLIIGDFSNEDLRDSASAPVQVVVHIPLSEESDVGSDPDGTVEGNETQSGPDLEKKFF